MAWADYDTNTSTGDSDSEFAQVTKDRTDALRIFHLSASDPASLANGMIWWVSISSTEYELRTYVDSTVRTMLRVVKTGNALKFVAAPDFNGNQAVNLICEKLATGSLPAASAANEGRICYDDTKDLLALITAAGRYYLAHTSIDGTTYLRIPCRLHVGGLGTPATADVSTPLGGWLLDAAGEQLYAEPDQPIPAAFTGGHDLALVATCVLAAAETAGDDIDLAGAWRSVTPNAEAANKSATSFVAVAQDVSTNNAQYSLHEVALAITYNDATNPVAAGDRLVCTLQRNGLTNVAGVIVASAHIRVPVYGFAG